jgi:hypothetical protein
MPSDAAARTSFERPPSAPGASEKNRSIERPNTKLNPTQYTDTGFQDQIQQLIWLHFLQAFHSLFGKVSRVLDYMDVPPLVKPRGSDRSSS